MTPGARVAAAIGVLDAWLAGRPAEQALTNWARGARYAGAKDREAVRDHVYDVLRARGRCAALGGGDDGRALMLGLLQLQGQDPGAFFTGEGHAPATLSRGEAALQGAGAADPRADLPGWTIPLLEGRAGGDPAALFASFAERAPLYLRVNLAKASLASAQDALAAEGIVVAPDARARTALVVLSGARKVKSSIPYAEGWVEPQDLSVQRAVLAFDWAGRAVLDYCAGGGGKSLAIAALGAARVAAHDADPRRMADLGPRADRAGARIETWAGKGQFDVVLCDVPCSGSGTWRRDPEAKWRLTPEGLARLTALQARILEEASRHLRPGGVLVYMTCSLFQAENEGQIAAFLARRPGWSCTQQAVETPLTASDGFFHAVLQAA